MVGAGRVASRERKGGHGGGRDGIGRWLRQGKRRTHKANMDNIAINNHKGGA